MLQESTKLEETGCECNPCIVCQAFSKRIRFAIEDLLDLRKNKWQKMLVCTSCQSLVLND